MSRETQATKLSRIEADSTARFDRIEDKIDKLSDAIIALARAEEKILTLTSFSKQQSEQIQRVINRVDSIEELVTSNSSTINIINKIFWIIMASAATVITGMLILQ
jgi:DNA repair exonuclease SbcCD ATPase subunit